MTHNSSEDGFTLLETLVAFTIATSVLIIAMRAFSTSFQAQQKVEDQYHMARFAKSKLNEATVLITSPQDVFTGSYNEEFQWTLSFEPNEEPESNSHYDGYWANIKISKLNDPENKLFELQQLILVPDLTLQGTPTSNTLPKEP